MTTVGAFSPRYPCIRTTLRQFQLPPSKPHLLIREYSPDLARANIDMLGPALIKQAMWIKSPPACRTAYCGARSLATIATSANLSAIVSLGFY